MIEGQVTDDVFSLFFLFPHVYYIVSANIKSRLLKLKTLIEGELCLVDLLNFRLTSLTTLK